jgi:hypothetical protein
LPAAVDEEPGISPPSNDATWLACFTSQSDTFTPAARGSHIVVNAVRFGKGGEETLQVTQADDPAVYGATTSDIA